MYFMLKLIRDKNKIIMTHLKYTQTLTSTSLTYKSTIRALNISKMTLLCTRQKNRGNLV